MKILWKDITEDKYNDLIEVVKYNEAITEDYLGAVCIGQVKADLILEKGFMGNGMLIVELYIGGVSDDDAYGYTNEGNLPYNYCGRFEIVNKNNIMLFQPYEKFKEKIIDSVVSYAKASDYCKDGITIMDKLNSEEIFSWD